jgi:hypothetical protein
VNTRAFLAAVCLLPALALAQPAWHASQEKEHSPRPALFRSVMTADFPTTETAEKGDFHFEISHRFFPPVKDGYSANFGFDGPATMRLALGYGLTERLMVTLGRSNLLDNLDLQVKYRLLQVAHPRFPAAAAVRGGVALNTDISGVRDKLAADNVQYYLQLVGNALLLDGRLGIGVVPSYLYNSTVFSVRKQYTLTLGNYYQYFINGMWGLWLEYNPAIAGYQGSIEYGTKARSHDSLALGVSIETGGHTFYVFATNNTRLNPAQYLVGAADSARPKNWRLAFGLTRYL